MLIKSTNERVDIDYYALATLKQLAREGAMTEELKTSSSSLAEELDISAQTARRRLQTLDESGLINRQSVNDGQQIFVTDLGGDVLRSEYEQYRELFEPDQSIVLDGTVVNGLGEGAHFISLEGYKTQFIDKLGYEPFSGTLNVDLHAESIRTRSYLRSLDPIKIDGWEDDTRTFGPVYCLSARFETDGGSYEPVHVIKPERSHYEDDKLEVIAADELREELGVETGDQVAIHVDRN